MGLSKRCVWDWALCVRFVGFGFELARVGIRLGALGVYGLSGLLG